MPSTKGSEGERGHGKAIIRSTQSVPVRMRVAYWREAVSTVLPSLTVDYQTEEPPHARLESRTFADAQVNRFIDDTAACHVAHRPPSGGREAYLLVLQLTGSGCYRHAGREVMLEPDDMVLLDMSRRFDLTFPKGHHELVWVLPREALAPLLAHPGRLTARISGRQGFGALLAGSMRTLAGEAGRLDATSQRSLRLHLCNLAALTFTATLPVEEARRKTYRMERRQQILTYLETHLGEHGLTADKAAHELKMSRRWLHELLSEGGTSFSAWIVRRRIEECLRLLEDPRHDHLSVSTIAFRHGFNDLSTFYRQFRAHCGTRPRDVRRERGPARQV